MPQKIAKVGIYRSGMMYLAKRIYKNLKGEKKADFEDMEV